MTYSKNQSDKFYLSDELDYVLKLRIGVLYNYSNLHDSFISKSKNEITDINRYYESLCKETLNFGIIKRGDARRNADY